MNKNMTTESVAGAFTTATKIGVDTNASDINAGNLEGENYLKQIGLGGAHDANAVQVGIRNGKPKMFDDAANRGPNISPAAGFCPTSIPRTC